MKSAMRGLWQLTGALLLVMSTFAAATDSQLSKSATQRFDVDDYFQERRIKELAISSDGEWIVFLVERYSLSANATERSIHVQSIRTRVKRELPELRDRRQLAWIPGTHKIASIGGSGRKDLMSYDVDTGQLENIAEQAVAVSSYKFSARGNSLAYIETRPNGSHVPFYRRLREGDSGFVLDPDTTSSHSFLNPGWDELVAIRSRDLFVMREGHPARAVEIPGEPIAINWSDDGKHASVTYVDADIPPSELRLQRTSVGVLDAATGSFRRYLTARPPNVKSAGVSYAGGEWVPNDHRFLIRRVVERDPWVSWSYPDCAVVSAAQPPLTAKWTQTELVAPIFNILDKRTALVETTRRGVRDLYKWREGSALAPADTSLPVGSNSLFAFTSGSKHIVFVNSALNRPAEIFSIQGGGSPVQLTNINAPLSLLELPKYSEWRWTSSDGVEVSGWLLEPDSNRHQRPWPLITMIHGGPTYAFPNAFAPYFSFAWPYPFEAYVSHGMAVFVPNYRGTGSYGRHIQDVSRQDYEPIEDIVSGISRLVEVGIADPARLGISGQSHGAWLGSLVMTRKKTMFKAASFAEGSGNRVLTYELMSGRLNREVHDVVHGGSLYDIPATYIDRSPDMHMSGVSTATLFETGAYSSGLYTLGHAKAARRFHVPSEAIIYPKTSHNIVIPKLMRESAQRNLNWFLFWLKNEETSEPASVDEYSRWRRLKQTAAEPVEELAQMVEY